MSTTHYNNIFCNFWYQHRVDLVYQPCCLQRPYSSHSWPIKYPEISWRKNTVVVMHCQDFVSINQQGCPELQDIERHFGPRANQVIVVHWNYDLGRVYSGPLNLIYFPTHSYEILLNLNSEKYPDWQKHYHGPRQRVWQCLNGVPRPHRRLVHEWLKPRPNGIVSLSNIDPLPQDAYHTHYTWRDIHNGEDNEINFMNLTWLYSTTQINVVTETQYEQCPGIISEKTLLALLAGQIPIVIGYRGIVEDCRRLGFDMFDDIVDNSYDDLPDIERWQAALERNQHLLEQGIDYWSLKPRFDRQREFLLNQWPQIMIDHYHQRCAEIADSITKT